MWSVAPVFAERDTLGNVFNERDTMGKRPAYQKFVVKDLRGWSLSRVCFLLEEGGGDGHDRMGGGKKMKLQGKVDDYYSENNYGYGDYDGDDDDTAKVLSLTGRLSRSRLKAREAGMEVTKSEQCLAIAKATVARRLPGVAWWGGEAGGWRRGGRGRR